MWFFDHYFAHHFFRFSFSRKTHARIPRKHDVLSNYFKIQQFYTVLISRGAISSIKFMTSFAESNLSSCADFITLIAVYRLTKSQR